MTLRWKEQSWVEEYEQHENLILRERQGKNVRSCVAPQFTVFHLQKWASKLLVCARQQIPANKQLGIVKGPLDCMLSEFTHTCLQVKLAVLCGTSSSQTVYHFIYRNPSRRTGRSCSLSLLDMLLTFGENIFPIHMRPYLLLCLLNVRMSVRNKPCGPPENRSRRVRHLQCLFWR